MEICPFNIKRQYFSIGRIIFFNLILAGIFLVSSRLVFGFAPEEKQPPDYQIRTIKFFIFQNSPVALDGNSTTASFDIFIGEKDPVIKDAYIEISGVTTGANDIIAGITADIRAVQGSDCIQPFATPRASSFSLEPFGKMNNFKILYTGIGTTTDSSLLYCLERIIRSPGAYPFESKVDIAGADVSALSAKMVITYQFTPPTSGTFPVSGYVISSTFDTWDGIEPHKGVAYNSMTWKGNSNGGKIRMQIATSDNILGPWEFKGPSCSGVSGDEYTLNLPDEPVEIMCANIHNDKQFFRYKIILCSDDCQRAGSATPEVTDVVVNWSP